MIVKDLVDEIVLETNKWENKIHELQRKCKLENPDIYYLGKVLDYVTDLQGYCEKKEE